MYCYASVDGYVTHIKSSRVVGVVPPLLPFELLGTDEWHAAYQKQGEFLDTAEREDIGLRYSGETFTDDDLESFRMRLVELRMIGYRFPDYVFDEIDLEMSENQKQDKGDDSGKAAISAAASDVVESLSRLIGGMA